jgi:hypothetical protein
VTTAIRCPREGCVLDYGHGTIPHRDLDGDTLTEEVAAIEQIVRKLRQLGSDEHRVVLAIVERLTIGQQSYGPMDLATWRDRRPKPLEQDEAEELLDAMIYQRIARLLPEVSR